MLKYVIHLIFLFGIYGAGTLAYNELIYGNICPKIINVPACYIILSCLIVPFIIHLIKENNSVYFIFTGLAWSIAIYGSIMEFLGVSKCPKTDTGIPMCYISLAIFTFLILLKIIQFKSK